jgi:acetyltransferase-like isoleucine patch superfamily enzyme
MFKNLIDKVCKCYLFFKVKREGGYAFSQSIRKFYINRYGIHIGYGSYGGIFDNNNIPAGVYVGNYCSIAQGVKIFRTNHPINYFTMHPLFYNPALGYVNEDILERPELHIGNDVWIGASSIILPTVKNIGNGAIIGAGSIVTKDVLPYSIIAGNPAKLISMRFSDDIIKKLEESKWWTLDKETLINNKEKYANMINGSLCIR